MLTALEQGRSRAQGRTSNLGGERTDLARGTAIHADLFTQRRDCRSWPFSSERNTALGLLRLGEALGQGTEHLFLTASTASSRAELALGQQRLSDLLGGVFLDSGVFLVGVVQEQREIGGRRRPSSLSLAQRLNERALRFEGRRPLLSSVG